MSRCKHELVKHGGKLLPSAVDSFGFSLSAWMMTDLSPYPSDLTARGLGSRALWQGALIMGSLTVMAVGMSLMLTRYAGAAQPEWSAGLTAVVCTIGSAIALTGLRSRRNYPHVTLGLCNFITLLRGAGIAVLAGLVFAPVSDLGWALVAIAGALLVLDGIDGWAARRAGLESRFGARLDMETDVAFAITLAALAVALGQVGFWFILIGLLRPLFMAVQFYWPTLKRPLPDARWRKLMAGLQMGVQVLVIAPILPASAATMTGAILLVAMIFSFGVDIRWLLRRANHPQCA